MKFYRSSTSVWWKIVMMLVPVYFAGAQPARAQEGGVWEGPFDWPLVAIHTVHLPTGRILVWSNGVGARVWNPQNGTFARVPNYQTNLFCAGQTGLADGTVLVAGGHIENNVGLVDANVFDPSSQRWTRVADMAFGRWYPTCTTLADGRVLALSGSIKVGKKALIPEVYDPTRKSWTTLPEAQRNLPLYPFMFVLPDGKVFFAGPGTSNYTLDVEAQTWDFVASSAIRGGSAVMYTPGKVLKSGGSDPAVKGTQVIDLTQQRPTWRTVASMAFARRRHNLTLLPDGTILVTGGTEVRDEERGAVYAAELFDPHLQTWTTLARMRVPRMYHSTAFLLPNGRVLSAGGNNHPSAEIFSPPYLFKGPRPTIVSGPRWVRYGTQFSLQTPQAERISKVSLIRLGAVTHAFDHSQRFVPLLYEVSSNRLIVAAPVNGNIAPPGDYMLFIVSEAGVPSVAKYVRLGENFCSEEASLKSKCRQRKGINRLKTTLKNVEPDTTVTFRLDGDPNTDVRKTVKNNGKAKTKFKRVPDGEHTVEIVECSVSKGARCP